MRVWPSQVVKQFGLPTSNWCINVQVDVKCSSVFDHYCHRNDTSLRYITHANISSSQKMAAMHSLPLLVSTFHQPPPLIGRPACQDKTTSFRVLKITLAGGNQPIARQQPSRNQSHASRRHLERDLATGLSPRSRDRRDVLSKRRQGR